MSSKLYWGLASLIIFLVLFSVFLVFVNRGVENETSKHVPESTEQTTSKKVKNKSILASEQSDKQDTKEDISPMTIEEVSNQITKSSKGVDIDSYSKLSLKELLTVIDKLEPDTYIPLLKEKAKTSDAFADFSDKEYAAFQTAVRRAYPQAIKKAYEKNGLEVPPPGYTYLEIDGESPVLVKFNTPIVRVNPNASMGYQRWDQLSQKDWERYKALDIITRRKRWNDNPISREMAELAVEWKKPLREKAYGPWYGATIYAHYNRPKTEEDIAYERQLQKDALSKLKRPQISHSIDPKLVDNLLIDLKEALNKR